MICILKMDHEGTLDGFVIGADFDDLRRRCEARGQYEIVTQLNGLPPLPRAGNLCRFFTDSNGFEYHLLVD